MTSAERRRKLRKRSAAKRPPKPLIFYVDECLGTHVPAALIAAGLDVRPWYDHFPGVPDVEWLPPIGARRWVLLTKDREIRRRPIEVQAILNARVRAFVLVATALRREEQATLILGAMKKIHRICKRPGPFIYNITTMGALSEVPYRILSRRAHRRPPSNASERGAILAAARS